MRNEHFTVDGTLIEAWARLKSFQRKDERPAQPPPDDPGNPTVNFHGERADQRDARIDDGSRSAAGPQRAAARRRGSATRRTR